jgi:hypothetical protein
MLFKKKVPYQAYCTSCVQAALENTDDATLEEFQKSCGDDALNAADRYIYQNHLRALFIEMLLIAIAKTCRMIDMRLQAQIFVNQKLKELNLGEVSDLCHTYSQVFASPSPADIANGTDGIRSMACHFNGVVCAGRLKRDTIDRLHAELYAVFESHVKDFKRIKLTSSDSLFRAT